MDTILDRIVAAKTEELREAKIRCPPGSLERGLAAAPPLRDFTAALSSAAASHPAIIAEIKRGSPSLGCIRPDLNAAHQAEAYATGGAAALSVLTDRKFFWGSDDDFTAARDSADLPMLRKEFIIDDYQIAESRVMGCDCILLIMSILTDRRAAALADSAHALGMTVLAETHSREEVRRTLDHVDFDLIGINNRNLKTFDTRAETTVDLAAEVPDRSQLIAESGLHSPEAIRRLWGLEIRRFLIGEALIKSATPAATLAALIRM